MRSTSKFCGCLLLLALASSVNGQPVGGTSSVSVGKDLVVDSAPTQGTPLPLYKPMGRKAGPAQAAAAADDQAGPRTAAAQRQLAPAVGINDPNLLTFCRPGNGTICSDRDYTELLRAQPANIDLQNDNFAYASLIPAAEVATGTDTKLDIGGRSFSTAGKTIATGAVRGNVGTQTASAASDNTLTSVGAALKNNRLELPVPEKLTVTLGKFDTLNAVESGTNKPNFYYVLGQNFGLPNGFALAKDGVTGKR